MEPKEPQRDRLQVGVNDVVVGRLHRVPIPQLLDLLVGLVDEVRQAEEVHNPPKNIQATRTALQKADDMSAQVKVVHTCRKRKESAVGKDCGWH